jgi:hypothetical protein
METPLSWLDQRKFQELADLVEDMLTGNPS